MIKPTKRELVERELREYVAARGGTVPSPDLFEHLQGMGFGKTSIELAKRDAGRSTNMGFQGGWVFSLYADSDRFYKKEAV